MSDPERYQTTYARLVGSAAAPTAGLHFTPALDAALAAAGVTIETVTLHVGLGTFKPLVEATLAANRLHSESYEVDAAVWARLLAARAQGRRVVAVGTTSVRVLEHMAPGLPGRAEGGDAAGAVRPSAARRVSSSRRASTSASSTPWSPTSTCRAPACWRW